MGTRPRANTPELTTFPSHTAQRDLAPPRGPVEWDAHLSTTGIGYLAKATCPSNANHSKYEPLNMWWAFQQVAEEYQYFVRKRPPSPRSRRRRRYEERISWLSSRDGRTKKRRKLGQPGATNPNSTVDNSLEKWVREKYKLPKPLDEPRAPLSHFDNTERGALVLYAVVDPRPAPRRCRAIVLTDAQHVARWFARGDC